MLVNEPQEPCDSIDHCDGKNDECSKAELEHGVRTEITVSIDISYIEDLRSRDHHESDDYHSADEYINEIASVEECLDRISALLILTDDRSIAGYLFRLRIGKIIVVLQSENDDKECDRDDNVSSVKDKELVERRPVLDLS